ncbi:MAG: hypothetical protein J6I73_01075, partial [Treponema sp.]|nr:hypothetical protein [Treponema sp.]
PAFVLSQDQTLHYLCHTGCPERPYSYAVCPATRVPSRGFARVVVLRAIFLPFPLSAEHHALPVGAREVYITPFFPSLSTPSFIFFHLFFSRRFSLSHA